MLEEEPKAEQQRGEPVGGIRLFIRALWNRLFGRG